MGITPDSTKWNELIVQRKLGSLVLSGIILVTIS